MKINVISSTNEVEDKPPTAWDHHHDKNHVTLRQLLRPSLITMAICGCYSFDADGRKGGQANSDGRLYRVFGTFYRIVCLLSVVAACVKSVAAFPTVPDSFKQLNAINIIWLTQCLVIFLISFKATHAKYGSQKKAFDFWDEKIKPEMEELGIDFPQEKIKKRQQIYIFIATCGVLVNVGCLALFSADIFSRGLDVFYAAPFAPSVPVLVITNCLMVEITLLWIIPACYMIVISTLLTTMFEVFNEYLENHIKLNLTKMTCKCQRIRLLHLNLSKMVSYLDNDFGYYMAATFVFSIGLSCFILYMVLRSPMDTLTLVLFVFWILSPMCLLAAVSIHAAIVNDTAHGALDSIYYICVKDLTIEQLGQVNLFLSKLTGTQIGFTTLGLLTITKEFLLTIAGVFLTYFFLLYTL